MLLDSLSFEKVFGAGVLGIVCPSTHIFIVECFAHCVCIQYSSTVLFSIEKLMSFLQPSVSSAFENLHSGNWQQAKVARIVENGLIYILTM